MSWDPLEDGWEGEEGSGLDGPRGPDEGPGTPGGFGEIPNGRPPEDLGPPGLGPMGLDAFDDEDDPWSGRWPLSPRGMYPREQWLWFEQLWADACMLHERYHLALRSGWWEDELQVEVLAALAAWIHRYDSGEWDDPPGKLALLYDLERAAALLRDGIEPFHPSRDRPVFLRFLLDAGCQPPPNAAPLG